MQRTGIEYLTHSWNPIAMRCTPVSAGCLNCWHLAMAKRHAANERTISHKLREARAGGKPWLRQDELEAPLRKRKPARIGVQFMGDLFHGSIPFEWIAQVFFTMIGECSAEPSPQHTYLILTKRPERMAAFYEWLSAQRHHEQAWLESLGVWATMNDATHPRVWLGVSVEDQKTADERIRELLRIPASIRFVSYEPALGAADFNRHAFFGNPQHQRWIDWVIAGAETGPGRRRAELDWFRAVRDQCDAAGVPFFFKRDSDGNRELDGETHEAMP